MPPVTAEKLSAKEKLANFVAAMKKMFAIMCGIAFLGAIPLMLWKISGGVYGGVSTIEGIIDGVLFVVALWIGFMLGSFFAKRPPPSSSDY